MPYFAKEDLVTHIREEILDAIDRGDNTLIPMQIEAAVAEAKSYCSRFDVDTIFADDDAFGDANLLDKVKDIACWKIIKLANPNIKIELFRANYEDAIEWFKLVQSGKADPDWPVEAEDTDTDIKEGSQVQLSSNTARNNHF